jgi:hypothetical protein
LLLMRRPRTWFVLAFVAYALVIRLMPWLLPRIGVEIPLDRMVSYPWNFSPMMALCLFAGAHFARRELACLCPLLIMLLSDVLIGLLSGSMHNAFYSNTPVVYGALVAGTCIGFLLRGERTVWKIGGSALSAQILFYLVTNFGVWVGTGMYTPDLSGLVTCYTAALPFFRNSLFALAVFTPIAFSHWALLPELKPVPVRVARNDS